MVLRSEQETMQALIGDAITQLCKKHLHFKKGVSLEALVGITLDDDDIILVSVKETIKQSSPKKPPMQVALKSVQTAVQRVNAKSAVKKSMDEEPVSQRPSIINIVPTNLSETQESPVAIGTIETDSLAASEVNFDFLNVEIKEEETVSVKEERDDDSYDGASADDLVPGPITQPEDLLKTDSGQVIPSTKKTKSTTPTKPETSKRKMSTQVAQDRPKLPRMFVPEGKPQVPLDVRYLGLNRSITDDREYKRGRFLERLIEGSTQWKDLSDHQQNCVFAKGALRGREENEIVCSICYQIFTKAQDYKNHIKKHFGRMECSLCDKTCFSVEDLEAHLVTHMSNLFQCPLCNGSFPSKQALTTHIRNDHSLFLQESTVDESPEELVPQSQQKNKTTAAETLTEVTTVVASKQKSVKTPVKASIASRKEIDDGGMAKSVAGKPNTMQVTVVPQLVRTGSADSEPEETVTPKVLTSTVPLTRSRGKRPQTKN